MKGVKHNIIGCRAACRLLLEYVRLIIQLTWGKSISSYVVLMVEERRLVSVDQT